MKANVPLRIAVVLLLGLSPSLEAYWQTGCKERSPNISESFPAKMWYSDVDMEAIKTGKILDIDLKKQRIVLY
jgi:hypothetical protein